MHKKIDLYMMEWLYIAIRRLKEFNLFKEYTMTRKNYMIDLIKKRTKIISHIIRDIVELSGIEKELYCQIIVDGYNIANAIHNVSLLYKCDVGTIYDKYYPHVSKKINELIKIVFLK